MPPKNVDPDTRLFVANEQARLATKRGDRLASACTAYSIVLVEMQGLFSSSTALTREEVRVMYDDVMNEHGKNPGRFILAKLTAANKRADRWELAATNANGRARRFYRPDGSFEMLDSEVSVTLRRIEYEQRLYDAESALADVKGQLAGKKRQFEGAIKRLDMDRKMIGGILAEARDKIARLEKDVTDEARRVAAEAEWDSEGGRL